MRNKHTTYERVAELIEYNPSTGHFLSTGVSSRYKSQARGCRSKKRGERVGSAHRSGYRYICIDYKRYPEHQLAFLLTTKEWPRCQVDHINRDKADNRMCNLRLAPRNNLDNAQNQNRSTRNKSGVTGVCWVTAHKRWLASIKVDRKNVYLGEYSNFFDAVCARKSAELHYFTFANG